MSLKKFVSLWALIALMLAQVALATHSASHIDHGVSIEIASFDEAAHQDDHHDHDRQDAQHSCPECILTQSLQAAYYHAPVIFSTVSTAVHSVVSTSSDIIRVAGNPAHAPRAPPVFLN